MAMSAVSIYVDCTGVFTALIRMLNCAHQEWNEWTIVRFKVFTAVVIPGDRTLRVCRRSSSAVCIRNRETLLRLQ
jgi:hypothetical protein